MICNIDQKQIAIRKRIAITSLVLAIATFIAMQLLGESIIAYFILFGAIFSALLNYLQVRRKFCAYFALKGITTQSGEAEQVDQDLRKEQLLFALRLIFEAAIITAGILLIFIYLMS